MIIVIIAQFSQLNLRVVLKFEHFEHLGKPLSQEIENPIGSAKCLVTNSETNTSKFAGLS